MSGMVTAIVLAAGESRRMGALKPLLPYGSGTVLQTVVHSLKHSPVDRILVVLGHRSEEIAATLAETGAEILLNPRHREGMLTSVQAGISAAPAETEWIVLALGDQPSLRPATVDRLLEEARNGTATIVVPSYAGRRGHPLLIHASHRAEIAALEPELGLRQLLRSHPEAIRHVEFPDEAVLRDMDTPEEYRRELAHLAEEQAGP